MALLYRADLTPGKLELVARWAPGQPWFDGDRDAALRTVASFRFDDPDGQVGVETLLVRAGDGPVMQIPLTYRNEELPGAKEHFLGTMEHSVLGTRWTYDGLGDPVYLAELAKTILTGGSQVEQWMEIDGVMTRREPTAVVVGTGDVTSPDFDAYRVDVVRVPDASIARASELVLAGTWTDHPEPTVLAHAEAR
jgi:Maltokinase N-terminal cap domain